MDAAFRDLIMSCDGSPATFAARVYPEYAPQNPQAPYMVYYLITGPRDYTQDGPDGVTKFRYQVDIYANTNAETETIRNLLTAGMSGQLGATHKGVKIQAAFLDNEQLLGVGELEPPGPRLFRRVLDWFVTAEHG